MPTLVFSDMDDTFLAPDKSIPVENLAVLDLLAERGIGLVPCTGRSVAGVPEELVASPCVTYAICGGGAITYDLRSGEPIRVNTIEKDVVRALRSDLGECACTFDIFTVDGIFTAEDRWGYLDVIDVPEPMRKTIRALRTKVSGTTDELIESLEGICRISLYFADGAAQEHGHRVLAQHPELYCVSSASCNVEITRADTSKGAALRWLCEYLCVDVADTIAFGDSGNDVSMLQAAGDGVAVANATEECRAAADHVTDACDEAGVARYLNSVL